LCCRVEGDGDVQTGAHSLPRPKAEMYNELQTFVLKIVVLLAFSAFLAVVVFGR
jgi:hypothetical protein